MNSQELKKLENMKKKVGCEFTDCGQHFIFNVTEHALTVKNECKKIYVGTCDKCVKVLKLTESGLRTFKAVYGETNIAIIKSNFDQIFEAIN